MIMAIVVVCVMLASGQTFTHQASRRVTVSINDDWKYSPGDLANGQDPALSEAAFQNICIPHANKIVTHRSVDTAAFSIISWYRRHFTPAAEWAGRVFRLEFEGVSKIATVYVNGVLVGEHKGAYTGFSFDITDKVIIGKDNLIAVRVDAKRHIDIPPEGSSMDYMLFGGIVRDVSLIVTDPLHIDWVFLTTPEVSSASATLNVNARIKNKTDRPRNCSVITNVVDENNAVVAAKTVSGAIAARDSFEFASTGITIPSPRLWHPDHPYLYTVYTHLECDSCFVDEKAAKLGIRSIRFDKTDGKFYINDQWLKLRGINRHESYPFIGRAAANRLQRKDADLVKFDMGANIVRCSHYPQDPAFIDRCDEIGLLVLEEMPGWKYIGNAAWQSIALQNVREMILRDRNHPSIISFGVRINESGDAHDLYVQTNQLARTLDPSRPTHGVRIPGNGSTQEFLEDVWAKNFDMPVATPNPLPWITTEYVGHRCATHSWDAEQRLVDQMLQHAETMDSAAANTQIAGALGWCAFDYNSPYYIAEKTVCYHGMADMFRIPKHGAYFYASQADPALYGPMAYIADYWKNNSPDTVYVVSNCDRVELFVNNTSLGVKSPGLFMSLAHPVFYWPNVTFAPGELKAVGYIGNTPVTRHIRTTPGSPVTLLILPDDTRLFDGGDMTRVVVTAVDKSNQVVPGTDDTVELSVNGAGIFLGESPIALEDGKTAFFVQTKTKEPGIISCVASSKHLGSSSAVITVESNMTVLTRNNVQPAISHRDDPVVVYKAVLGKQFFVPLWAVGATSLYVYDLAGKLLHACPLVTSSRITMAGSGKKEKTPGIRIIKIVPRGSRHN